MQSTTVEVSDEELEAAAGGGGGIIKASIKMGKGATICATPYIVAISVRHCQRSEKVSGGRDDGP